MQDLTPRLAVFAVSTLLALSAAAHPGSGIVVDARGNVFVADINRGLLRFGADGKVTVVLPVAGHWLAHDSAGAFAGMEFERSSHWPRWFKHRNPPGEGLMLISDGGSPLAIRGGDLYYACSDEHMEPGGLQLCRLSPDGKLALVAPSMKARVDALGGIKGLATGPDALFATTPGAILKIGSDGAMTELKRPIVVANCDRYRPSNSPADHEPFLTGLALDSAGDVYLAATGCRAVVKLDARGQLSSLMKAEPPWSPTGLAFHDRELYVVEWTNALGDTHEYRPRVRELGRDGSVRIVGTVPE